MKSNKILSDVIHHMKYAKYLPELNRRETFEETCLRNMDMHIEKYPFLGEQIEQVYNRSVLTKKVLPAMRSMQFAGDAIKQNNVRMFNCSYAPCDSMKIFSESMFLLLSGVGFGYSVQFHHVLKLPSINAPRGVKTYKVSDSIEGWADAIHELIKAFLDNKILPSFDFSMIRKKGTKLSSGGKAPGYYPLKNCLDHIKNLFLKKLENNDFRLSTLDCHSIFCFIADAVLSGGIRRAAMIALFSFDDLEMRNCKSGQWWLTNPHFARANNSAIAPYQEITEQMFKTFWQDVEKSGAGEPGIIWSNNKEYGFNPCFTYDTKILSENGYVKIGENVGDIRLININGDTVNGSIWSNGIKSVIELTLSNKVKIKCTPDHRFLDIDDKEVMAKDLKDNRIKSFSFINDDINEFTKYGFLQGDGDLNRLNSKDHAGLEVNIGNKDIEIYKLFNIEQVENKRSYYIHGFNNILRDLGFSAENLPKRILPSSINTWSLKDKAMFLKGLYSANGSIIKNNRIAFKSTSNELIIGIQELLKEFDIKSYITTNKAKDVLFSNGLYKCKESYDLNISNLGSVINFAKNIAFIHKYKNDDLKHLIKIKSPKVISIKEAGQQEVFDFNLQDQTHWGVIEGVIAHNCSEAALRPYSFCNLVEINGSEIKDQQDFNQTCSDAAFINTLQASYTDFHYLRDIWKQTTDEDALIGVSITGIASGNLDNLDLKIGAEIVKKTNEEVSKLIGINKSARCTLVKPAGTTSLILGTSSGIHDWHDKFYLRRVRVNKQEAIYSYILENLPEIVENDNSDQHTAIFVFPQKAPDNAKIRSNTDVIELLERVKKYNLEWIRNGHNRGDNYHNVSATISIKGHEWEKVGSWIWNNRYNYHGLSVLPFDGGTYQQAPFESCDENTYNQYLSYFKDIDLKQIIEIEDNTEFDESIACSGGTCELI